MLAFIKTHFNLNDCPYGRIFSQSKFVLDYSVRFLINAANNIASDDSS